MIRASSRASRTMRIGVTGASVHAVDGVRPSCESRKVAVAAVGTVAMTDGTIVDNVVAAGIDGMMTADVVAVVTVGMIAVTTGTAATGAMSGGGRRSPPS